MRAVDNGGGYSEEPMEVFSLKCTFQFDRKLLKVIVRLMYSISRGPNPEIFSKHLGVISNREFDRWEKHLVHT